MTAISQRSFAGGEISPDIYGRVDQVKYQTGLRTARNTIIQRYGGTSNRPGTGHIRQTKAGTTEKARLIPFVFNAAQTYALEFGDLYMRVIQNGVQLTDLNETISGATKADPCVLTITGTSLANGDEIQVSGILGMTELNGRSFRVANKATNTVEIKYLDGTDVDSSAFTTYVSGGESDRVFELVTPYLEADLFNLHIAQSADVVTIVHPSYDPRDLTRTDHTVWTLTVNSTAPIIGTPTVTGITGTAGSDTFTYAVTAISDSTGEQSLAGSLTQGTLLVASDTDPHTITWNAVSGASNYNVFKVVNGVPGRIGPATGLTFVNDGIAPDFFDVPATANNPFSGANNRPSTVGYSQQRRIFGRSNNFPENIWTSKSGFFKNFTTSFPIQDDDSIVLGLNGRQVNDVRHIFDLNGKLVVLTSGGEWSVIGDAQGVLTAKLNGVVANQQSYEGSSNVQPLIIGSTALFIQERGSYIRDLSFNFDIDGYSGTERSVFSNHLVENFTLIQAAYQQIPDSIAWYVRSDGDLIGMTYVREHDVFAWHRHDFEAGEVESVISIPEGTEDSVYLIIKTTIEEGGTTRVARYIERMKSRRIDDLIDNVFTDSSLTYDGRNTGATTMTLTTGGGWTNDDDLTCTASAGFFTSADVGKTVQFYTNATDYKTLIRAEITAFTNTTVVTVRPHKDVPTSLQATATTSWALAIKTISGLWHLEGKALSVIGDRFVEASANNASYTTVTVLNGSVTLSEAYGVIHAGLPVTADVETLDIDTVQSETLADKLINITKVTLYLKETRGVWAGNKPPEDDTVDPLNGLNELKIRDDENYDDPVALVTQPEDITIEGSWTKGGRVFIRQVDPLPISLISIVPVGNIPFRK